MENGVCVSNGDSNHFKNITSLKTSQRAEINLSSPVSDPLAPSDDKQIRNEYKLLQLILRENGFPETEDRTKMADRKSFGSNQIAVAMLANPSACIGILLEGGRQCPGDVMLVMSWSWLSKEKSDRKDGLNALFVHKAITFGSDGRSFLDHFEPPRRVTYFMEVSSDTATQDFELDLDCPSSLVSPSPVWVGNDGVMARALMDEVGIWIPETLLFTYNSWDSQVNFTDKVTPVVLTSQVGVEDKVAEEISKFINSPKMADRGKFVVKPSRKRQGHLGVSYHQRTDVPGICKATLQLLTEMEDDDSVLVEAVYESSCTGGEDLGRGITERHEVRIRALVCRGADNKAHTTKIVCEVVLKNDNSQTSSVSIPQTFNTTLMDMGVQDLLVRRELEESLKSISAKLLQLIWDNETRMKSEVHTDLIGIEYIMSKIGGVPTPVGVEINSIKCLNDVQLAEFLYPESQGEAFHHLIQNAITRSQKFLMIKKTVLVIGGGGHSKKYIWDVAKDYGIEIVLVDDRPDHEAASKVRHFITCDLSDHSKDNAYAENIIRIMNERDIEVDGCVTFWEECGPLAAHICDKLGLSGAGLQAALTARSKSKTQQTLLSRKELIPQRIPASMYASRSYFISKEEDIERFASKMNFPFVMKPEYGASAIGVLLVQDIQQCHNNWNIIQAEMQDAKNYNGIGDGYESTMVLMDYVGGTEHDVDIVIHNRQLVTAFVTDNGPTRLPKFTETSFAMPSLLPEDKQRQMIVAAHQCCVGIGLVSGVFNVEMKMTPTGPKLLEINARMGGYYIRDAILALYDVDLLLCAFMIACDMKPIVNTAKASDQLIGVMMVPSIHRQALSDPENLQRIRDLEEEEKILVTRLELKLPAPEDDCYYDEPFWNIAVKDNDPETARMKLIEISDQLGINKQDYPVPSILTFGRPLNNSTC